MAAVRILGVDPGTMVAGFGCLELVDASGAARELPIALRAANTLMIAGRSDLRVVEAGVMRLGRRGDTVAERLGELAVAFAALLDRLQPREVALEEA
ncbi:MAG: Crossover junction endodeoxyribonuclease RuvC, partial [Planctomycetota bacterium]